MNKIIPSIVLFLVLIMFSSVAYCQTKLVGSDICTSDGGFQNSWKCTRFTATASGTAATCRVRYHNSGGTSDDIGCALYEDDTSYDIGSEPYYSSSGPGTLKAHGCYASYNFSGASQGDWISMNLSVDSSASISNGTRYWICFSDDTNDTLRLYRCNASNPPDNTFEKLINNGQSPVTPCSPPPGGEEEWSDEGAVTGSYGYTIYSSGAVDTEDPTITITSPTTNPTYDNGSDSTFDIAGTASDNVSVSQVTWDNDRGGSGNATGTTSWLVNNINLQSGSNEITMTALDPSLNAGTDVITVTYTPPIIDPSISGIVSGSFIDNTPVEISGTNFKANEGTVELCDNATYGSCGTTETQGVSAWGDTDITFQVNIGSLTGTTAYLYVTDEFSNVSDSFEVTIVSEPGIYYVDYDADPGCDGLSQSLTPDGDGHCAWDRVSDISNHTIVPGDEIYLQRGDTWREGMVLSGTGTSESIVPVSAYGEGDNPVLIGSDDFSSTGQWTQVTTNTWRTSAIRSGSGYDVGFMLFGSESVSNLGNKEFAQELLDTDNDYFYDSTNYWVVVWVDANNTNPATHYGDIEIGYPQGVDDADAVVIVNDVSYISISNIDIKYANGHGFLIQHTATGCDTVMLQSCNVSFSGGKSINIPERIGNGISVLGQHTDIIIGNNNLLQVYESGIAVETGGGGVTIGTTALQSNTIEYCKNGVEVIATQVGGLISDITINDNLLSNTGRGYGGSGYGIYLRGYYAGGNIISQIYGNTIDNPDTVGFGIFDDGTHNIYRNKIVDSEVYGMIVSYTDYPSTANAVCTINANYILEAGSVSFLIDSDADIDFNHSIISKSSYAGMYITGNGDLNIYNNIFSNNSVLTAVFSAVNIYEEANNVDFRNNILYSSNARNLLYTEDDNGVTVDYNLYYTNSGRAIRWNNIDDYDYDEISCITSGCFYYDHGQEESAKSENPRFFDESEELFFVREGSVVIDAGLDLNLTYDFDGIDISSDSEPNIGAFSLYYSSAGDTFYASSIDGRDECSGLSYTCPWKTVAKVNSAPFGAGDVINFTNGSVFRDQLVIDTSGISGSPITYRTIQGYQSSSTGEISNYALFLGSVSGSDQTWTRSGNVWSTASNSFTSNPGVVYWNTNSVPTLANETASEGGLLTNWTWWYDATNDLLKMYLSSDISPPHQANGLEIGRSDIPSDEGIIHISNASVKIDYIVIDGLMVRYSPSYGVSIDQDDQSSYVNNDNTIQNNNIAYCAKAGVYIDEANDTSISNNEISHCNSGLNDSTQAIVIDESDNFIINLNRMFNNYSDGIKVIKDSSTGYVYDNYIYNNLSGAYINVDGANAVQVYRNKCTGNAGVGILVGREDSSYNNTNNRIYRNICYGSGAFVPYKIDSYGGEVVTGTYLYNNVGHSTGTGQALLIASDAGNGYASIIIKNNIFSTEDSYTYHIRSNVDESDFTFDYNLYYRSSNVSDALMRYNDTDYGTDDWGAYKTASGEDANSPTPTNPYFVSPSLGDFRVRFISKTINRGENLGTSYDNALDPTDIAFPFTTVDADSFGTAWEIGPFVSGKVAEFARDWLGYPVIDSEVLVYIYELTGSGDTTQLVNQAWIAGDTTVVGDLTTGYWVTNDADLVEGTEYLVLQFHQGPYTASDGLTKSNLVGVDFITSQ